MDKVKLVFYKDYGNKKVKEVKNVIPTSIRTFGIGKNQTTLQFTISDVIKHDGSVFLSDGIVFSIMKNE